MSNSSAAAPAAAHTPHTPIGRVLALAVGLAAVVAVVVLAFAWPSVRAEPHDLPVAVVGTDEAVTALTDAFEEQQPGVFDLQQVDDRDAAVTAIEEREVYGAILIGAEPEVLTSSAANLSISQLLTTLASGLEHRHPGRLVRRPAG